MNEEEKEIPYNYSPRKYQKPVLKALKNGCKKVLWIVHRRAGKDITALNYTIWKACQEVGVYYYVFPTYSQAKKVIWDSVRNDGFRIIDHFPKEIIESKNSQEMKIRLINGSLFQLVGSDNPDSLRGTNPKGVVFSEYAMQDPRAYEFIKPILTANGGWAFFISTPMGHNHLWELYNVAKNNPKEWWYEVLTIRDTNVISEEEIEKDRRDGMSEEIIQQEYFCFPPNTEIFTSNGLKNISDIIPNDFVLSHSGRFRKVMSTIDRHYDGELVSIRTHGSFEPIICTPNHPIRIYNRTEQKYRWIPASELTLNDHLTYPKMWRSKTKIISKELSELIAWYICEGSCFKGGVNFSFGKKEIENISTVERIIQNMGIKTKTLLNEINNCVTVIAYDTKLSDFLMCNCGSGAKNKKIPLSLISGYEKEVYKTLIMGDGCIHKPKNGGSTECFTTVSKTLAYQVQLLAHTLGKKSGIVFRKKQEGSISGRKINGGVSYNLQIRKASVAINKRSRGLFSGKNCIAAKIISIEKIQYSGKVYNFHVQYDESYVVGGRSVHNCSFSRGIDGSYYGRILQKLRLNNQIKNVPTDSYAQVHTAWDIGFGDSTAIWFYQLCGNEVHLIDYYQNQGEGISHYASILDQKRRENTWVYGNHFAPHDAGSGSFDTGMTKARYAEELGIKFIILKREAIDSGIERVRKFLPKCWFDENKCHYGIRCLDNYRKRYNEEMKIYSENPLHDKWSNGADAFRYACNAIENYQSSTTLALDEYRSMKEKYFGVSNNNSILGN